jgi:hypothetical protein
MLGIEEHSSSPSSKMTNKQEKRSSGKHWTYIQDELFGVHFLNFSFGSEEVAAHGVFYWI